jgi:hypothetical protein
MAADKGPALTSDLLTSQVWKGSFYCSPMNKLDNADETGVGVTWGAMSQALEGHVRGGDPMLLLISPFIGLEALKRCVDNTGAHSGIKVVTRWRPEDVRTGVSDISIFPYLRERGIPLYVNDRIHLKLYICHSNIAFSTSGNLTLRGFGYVENANIEIGSFVHLRQLDWLMLYELIRTSRQVDEQMYERYRLYLENVANMPEFTGPPLDLGSATKTYTISSLPAMESPDELAQYYFFSDAAQPTPELLRRATHDLFIFDIPSGLSKTEFTVRLGDSFRRSPFVVDFIEVLQVARSLRFGAVNEWIHSKCEDVPLPYRWEIKDNTRILYNWLQHFIPEVSWSQPNYSQVICWQGK